MVAQAYNSATQKTKEGLCWAPVTHIYNPSYMGGRDWSWGLNSRPTWANSLQDPIFKLTRAKWTGGVSSGRVPALQVRSPAFKPQFHQQKRQKVGGPWSEITPTVGQKLNPMWKITKSKKSWRCGSSVEHMSSKHKTQYLPKKGVRQSWSKRYEMNLIFSACYKTIFSP
jgi:hypothetical protein